MKLIKPIVFSINFLIFVLLLGQENAFSQNEKLSLGIGFGTYLGPVIHSELVNSQYCTFQVGTPLSKHWGIWYELGIGQKYLGFYDTYLRENVGFLGSNRNTYSFVGVNRKLMDKKWGSISASTGFGFSSLQGLTYYQIDDNTYQVYLNYNINPAVPLKLGYEFSLGKHISIGADGTLQLLATNRTYLQQLGLKLNYKFMHSKRLKLKTQ